MPSPIEDNLFEYIIISSFAADLVRWWRGYISCVNTNLNQDSGTIVRPCS